ncbi:type VI lipase adapter Tla3 domain-containing protein [Massilia rubra]|uniref:DUF2875 domain-containing protein n=1 Tax=Massilia rubra TaxID=2607910 RepID=A0ABX0LQ65_9BURK|nr:DUF2875 family protein [Massilia rubra]NHZ34546.1 DUF2875 domain-containing protein [Massilia rubra]
MSRTAPPPLARRAPRAWALAALLAAPAWGAAPTLINKMDPLMSQTQTGSTFPPIESLELVGVGVAVETWRNHPDYPKANLWQAVQDSNGSYIVSQDPKQYPKTLPEWQMMASKRNLDTIDAAVREFMDRYPLPISVVAPSFGEPDEGPARELSRKSNAHSVVVTTVGGPYTAPGSFRELLTQSGQVLNSYLNDEPDALWQTLFATFEQNADVPAIGVAAKDSAMHRALSFKRSDPPRYEKLAAEQVYRPKQARVVSDSFAMLVLAQRARVERLRPFAPFVTDTMVVKNRGGRFSRNWSEFAGWKKNPPTPFVPTPFLAKPWTAFQVAQFDHLEHFGTVHRPLVVSYLDDAGKPVKALEKAARMQSALRAALAPLGGKPPARIFYDYGSVWDDRRSGERFVPLVQGLHAIDDDIDLLDPKRGFDLARILGDTGAASAFVGVALASMAGRQSGGATLVANLRRNDGATLLLVTPPSAEQMTNDAAVKRPYFPSTAGVKDTF